MPRVLLPSDRLAPGRDPYLPLERFTLMNDAVLFARFPPQAFHSIIIHTLSSIGNKILFFFFLTVMQVHWCHLYKLQYAGYLLLCLHNGSGLAYLFS